MSPRPDQPDDATPDPAEGTSPGGAAERIIEKFGGIRPMAHKLEIPVTTVQGWKKRGAIPTARHVDLLAAATRHGIALDPEELAAAAPSEEPSTTDAPVPDDRPDPAGEHDAPASAAGPIDEPAADAPPVAPPTSPKPDPAPSAPPASAAAAPPRRTGARNLAAAAAVLSLLALGTALTAPWWAGDLLAPALGEPRSPAAVTALEAQVEDLASRLAAAERPQDGPGADAARLAEALSALEARVTEVAEAARRAGELAASAASGTGEAAAARIAEVERRLGALASRVPEQPVDAAQLDQQLQGLRTTLDLNAQAIAVLETEANRLAGELSAAAQRVAGLARTVEQRQAADADTQALVLAAGQLRAALQGSGSFVAELRTLRQLGIEDGATAEAVAALAPHAEDGIPTRTQLEARFSRLAPDIVRAERAARGGQWYDRALDRMSSLVSVRRVGSDVPGDDAAAVVARTEALIADGDLDGAVAELSTLQGPAVEVAEPWLTRARARLLADRASEALTRHAIGRLAGFGTSNATSGSTANAQGGGTVQQ